MLESNTTKTHLIKDGKGMLGSDISPNVPRVPEVWLLPPYPLRFWEHAVIRIRMPREAEDAMDGVSPRSLRMGIFNKTILL